MIARGVVNKRVTNWTRQCAGFEQEPTIAQA